MELESHRHRIYLEHSYSLYTDSISTYKNLDLNTYATVQSFLPTIEEIPTWDRIIHEDIDESVLADSVQYKEISLLQEKYEETIQCLQTLIKNIVKVAVREEEKANEVNLPDAQRKVEKLVTKLDEVFTTQRQCRNEFINQLKRQSLQCAVQKKRDVDNQCNIQNLLKNKENNTQKKHDKETAKRNQANKDLKLKNLKVRYSELETELKNYKKEYAMQEYRLSKAQADLNLMEIWLKTSLKSYKGFRKKLSVLNDDLRYLIEGQMLSLEISESDIIGRTKKIIDSTLKGDKFEKHECLAREINIGLEVLSKNLSVLKDELFQKKEQCSFLEAESRILRAELGLKGS